MSYRTASFIAAFIAIQLLLVTYCDGAAVTLTPIDKRGENLISDVDYTTVAGLEELPDVEVDERVDIIYNSSAFNEIDQDILQVIGNPTTVSLSCHSVTDNSSSVDWYYHGVGGKDDSIKHDQNDVQLTLSTLPPVSRMECVLYKNKSIRNSTFVYTGDGKPPYLHNHGKSVKASVLNETTASLPCLLNYPLDNNDLLELQLFKDGEMVENKNNCLSYTPELGYFLNLTKLDNPLGNYECRVVNSTKDDVVSVELKKDNFIRVLYKGFLEYFFEGAPYPQSFQCILPKSMFEKDIGWFYLRDNGTRIPIYEFSVDTTKDRSDALHYMQTIKVTFPSVNITSVGCAAFAKGSPIDYSNSVPVVVKKPSEPEILNGPSKGPIIYPDKKNLTCATYANPVNWEWLKNGQKVTGLNITEVYNSSPVRRSTISLDPSADDWDSNYTCVASNFLGKANYSFRVQLPNSNEEQPNPNPNKWLVTLLIVLALVVLLAGFLLVFFKVNVTRRRLDKQHIKNFFRGFGSQLPPYDELEESVEPYASISYDSSREIKYKSLIFERKLKAGQFGQVIAGRLLDTSNRTSIPVAIKSVKDDPKRSQEEIEDAFLNFLNEIKLMQFIGFHRNVVGYVGAVTSDIARYSAYLVVEYCSEGDLGSYLEKYRGSFHDDVRGLHLNSNGVTPHGPNTVLRSSHLLKWAEDIAAGLEYIASKRIVHMDLAARNVLLAYPGINSEEYSDLDPGRLIAKISDFGISRHFKGPLSDYYQIIFHPEPEKNKPRQLPLRWMSIEALESLKFTTQSDVWALAVTYWEMFTLGNVPYKDVIEDNSELRVKLISYIRAGCTLVEPNYAHTDLWDIMVQCWDENPDNRPSLSAIRESLHRLNEIENERIRRELENRVRESPENVQPPMSSYCQVGLMENLNLSYNSTDDLECSMEYSDDEDDDAGVHNQAQSNL